MACLLWILGFELAPNVHLALHEAIGHHHHADDGIAHSYLALGERDEHGHDHGDEAADHGHGYDHEVEADHHHDEADHHHDEADHHHAEVAHHHDEADPHEHGDEAEHDEHAADVDDVVVLLTTSDPTEAIECFESNGHGRHAVAHRGLAVVATPPAWPPVASAPASGTTLRLLQAQPPRSLQPRHVRARGPPTATA